MLNYTHAARAFICSPAFVFCSIAISFFLGLGAIPLFDLDEGAFTEATREMIASGNYSATYLDGEPRYDKPIFFYWIQSASIHLFGFNEWAFRLPSAIAASFWVFAVFLFVKEFFNRRRAVIAALFIANSLWIALIARSAIADALLNLFLSLTLFDIWRYFENKKPSTLWRVYLWMALGTLTKGPVAVAVPLVASCLYLLTSRASLKSYTVYINPIGWIIYLSAISPWLIAVYLEQGSGFFEGFIVEHNLKRFSETRENHGGSYFYYIIALPFILIPLSNQLVPLLAKARQLWATPLSRFLILWFAVIFCVFSLSKTQLPHYILNACVPLIILIAAKTRLQKHSYFALALPLILAIVFVFLPELLAIAAKSNDIRQQATFADFRSAIPNFYRLYAIALLVLLLLLSVLKPLKKWQQYSLAGLGLNAFVYCIFVQVIWNVQQKPLHDVMAYIDNNQPQRALVCYKMHMPTISLYRGQTTALRAPEANELLLTRIDRIDGLNKEEPKLKYTKLYQSGPLVLFETATLEPGIQRD